MIFLKMDEAIARSMQAQLNAEDGVTSSSSSTSTSTSSGQINSQSETRRFASGTSTTRPIVNGNSGEHDSNRLSGSGNTLGDPVITRETSKRIYSSNIYTL